MIDRGSATSIAAGTITVRGEVDRNFQKDEAERVLRRLWGVKGVSNLITIKTRPTPSERWAKLDAVRSFGSEPRHATVRTRCASRVGHLVVALTWTCDDDTGLA
jgi:hypothetical protein